MRITTIAIAALLAPTPLLAEQPQTPSQAPSRAPAAGQPAAPRLGSIDFGFRGNSTDGDAARQERYRDLRDGAVSRVLYQRANDRYRFDFSAENVGYRDQRYTANYNGGRLKVTGAFASIPLNYSYLTFTPWVEQSPGVLTLSQNTRQLVQDRSPGVVGVPSSPAQLQTPSVYRGLSQAFDLRQRRDSGGAAVTYFATPDVDVNISFTTTTKGGHQPFGASFAFNNANEVPLPLDHRTDDFSAAIELAKPKGMLRFAWDGSLFDNKIQQLVWDNPVRATDTNPYDPNGYSNGNGPAQGRMSLAPNNSMNAVSAMALYKMPRHTTVNGTLSFTAMRQNEPLIPWTINPVINTAGVFAQFPGLAQLERATAEAKVNGINALVNLTSRPNRLFGLTARYRLNRHDNRTPIFHAQEYVRFDAVPEESGGETEPFDITENTFDLNATFNLPSFTSVRVGYGYDSFDRTGRSFSNMTDNIFRTSVDMVGTAWVTVRAQYDYTRRKGSGFSEDALEDGGAQPGLRFYDEADRDRHRGTLIVTLMPMSIMDVTGSIAAGKDTYKGPGHEFGLLDSRTAAYTIGANVMPMATVSFGANYGRDQFESNQEARNANPPGTDYGSWFDPNRTWALHHDETVNNVNLYLDLIRTIEKTNIRVAYDYSDSDNAFVHGGPRIQELLQNAAFTPGDTRPCSAGVSSCFIPLPNVTNRWHRLSADVQIFLRPRVGLGVGYWFEKFNVTDFATIDLPGQPGTPRIDYLGEISTGYGNRPYSGHTTFVRLLYLF